MPIKPFFCAVQVLALAPLSAALGGDGPAANVVVLGTDRERARVIAEHAEQVRRTAFEQLLGEKSPRPWAERCEIHVHPASDAFAAAVGSPPDAARGATSIEFATDRIVSRRIDVMGDGPDAIPDSVAHEIVHVVLAEKFTAGPPPRWADEGVATLFDDIGKQTGHESDFRVARARGLDFTGRDLLALETYPASEGRQRVFYGQSAALVRWLIARRDAVTFIRFVADLQTCDVNAAFERHYDIDMETAFDSAWKEVPPIQSLSFSIPYQ